MAQENLFTILTVLGVSVFYFATMQLAPPLFWIVKYIYIFTLVTQICHLPHKQGFVI